MCCVGELCRVTTLRGVSERGVVVVDKDDSSVRYGVLRRSADAVFGLVDSKERSSSMTSTGSIQPEVLTEAFV